MNTKASIFIKIIAVKGISNLSIQCLCNNIAHSPRSCTGTQRAKHEYLAQSDVTRCTPVVSFAHRNLNTSLIHYLIDKIKGRHSEYKGPVFVSITTSKRDIYEPMTQLYRSREIERERETDRHTQTHTYTRGGDKVRERESYKSLDHNLCHNIYM